jgi:hypothetical protein
MADRSRSDKVFRNMPKFFGTIRDYIELMLSRLFTGKKKVIDPTTAPPERFWIALSDEVVLWLLEHFEGKFVVTPKKVLSDFLSAVFSSMSIEEKSFTAFVAIRKFERVMVEKKSFFSEEIFLILQLLQKSGLDLDKKVFLLDAEIALPNDVLRSRTTMNTSVSYELARVIQQNKDSFDVDMIEEFLEKLEDLSPMFSPGPGLKQKTISPDEFFGRLSKFGIRNDLTPYEYISGAISTMFESGFASKDSISEIALYPPQALLEVISGVEELWEYWTTKGEGRVLKIVPEIRRILFTALFSFDRNNEERLVYFFNRAARMFRDAAYVTDSEMAFYDILNALVANGFGMDIILPMQHRTARQYSKQLLNASIRDKYLYEDDEGQIEKLKESELAKFEVLMEELGRGTYVKGAKSSVKLLLEKNGGDVEAAAQVMASTVMKPNKTEKIDYAVTDAMYAEERERYKVRKVAMGEKDLEWKRIKDVWHVKAVSWMSKKGYSPTYDSGAYNLFSDTWVTLVPDVKNFIRERMNGIKGRRKRDRLIRLLGIRPDLAGDDTKEGFVEFWVNPKDMFRPTPDPEIDDDIADLQHRKDVTPAHKAWFEKQVDSSYSRVTPSYPWTRLGYTYDWADNTTTNQGPSEFVVRKNAPVVVIKKYTTDDYGKN